VERKRIAEAAAVEAAAARTAADEARRSRAVAQEQAAAEARARQGAVRAVQAAKAAEQARLVAERARAAEVRSRSDASATSTSAKAADASRKAAIAGKRTGPLIGYAPSPRPRPSGLPRVAVGPQPAVPAIARPAAAYGSVSRRCAHAGLRTSPGGYYVVRRHDSLWRIAERHYGDGRGWVAIRKANRLRGPRPVIQPCQSILVP